MDLSLFSNGEAFRGMVSGHGGDGLRLDLVEVRLSNHNNSMITGSMTFTVKEDTMQDPLKLTRWSGTSFCHCNRVMPNQG